MGFGKRNFWIITSLVLAGIIGILSFLLVKTAQTNSGANDDQYPLLAKRLFLENPNDTIINFNPLREDVKKYLESTNIPHSFYFEYLPTGSNIRVGETNELVGASLMKIPLVMNLYKASEMGKLNLDQTHTIEARMISTDNEFGNTSHLKAGDKITLREAAKKTLTESDNTSAELINSVLGDKLPENEQAIQNLDVETTTKTGASGKFVLVGTRAYSSFLKCLYFSCFLSKDNSGQILQYLTESKDRNRLTTGLPAGTTFAHKIGSFSKFTQSDCGIVYAENRQYVICLMLQAPEDQVAEHFKKISQMTYNYIKEAN